MRVAVHWGNRPSPKRVTRTVWEDESVLCRLRYWRGLSAAGAKVTAATVQVAADNLTFLVNALAETVIGTYTGATGAANQIVFADANIASINNLVRTINGLGVGHPTGANLYRRMRAAIGDWRPGWVIGAGDGVAAGPANILLGENSAGYEVFADSSGLAVANTQSVCLGGPDCRRGSGPEIFDHFETDYVISTAGVLTPQREQDLMQEYYDSVRYQVTIDTIHAGAAFANNDKRLRVYDINDNLIWGYQLNALNDVPANVLSEDQEIFGPIGSPLFVELDGTGAFTDGPLSVSGYIRVC